MSYCTKLGGRNLLDVTKIDTKTLPKDIDVVTYGFPCQDISLSGHQKGLEHNGERTRSGLVWNAHDVIQATMPKVAICENVKNLVSKKFNSEFNAILKNLEDLGYNNYWQVLNARDFGIPQRRERIFIISIRKDIDNGSFKFPEGKPLTKCLADMLDEEVEPKYFLSEQIMKNVKLFNLLKENRGGIKVVGNCFPSGHEAGRILDTQGIAPTIKENHGSVVTILEPIRLGGLFDGKVRHQAGSIWDTSAVSPTLDTMQGGYRQPMIVAPPYRIRRLTPFECFKLMGFTYEDVQLLKENKISDTQLYKMAGNSIVVTVLEDIFKNLLPIIKEK